MKALTEFDFPEGEPEYTKLVLDIINKHELEVTGREKVKTNAIERIREKNPHLDWDKKPSFDREATGPEHYH